MLFWLMNKLAWLKHFAPSLKQKYRQEAQRVQEMVAWILKVLIRAPHILERGKGGDQGVNLLLRKLQFINEANDEKHEKHLCEPVAHPDGEVLQPTRPVTKRKFGDNRFRRALVPELSKLPKEQAQLAIVRKI